MILKRRILLLLLLIYLFVTVYSCAGSKENYLNRYERFIGKMREKHENYNERDWKKTDIQLRRLGNSIMITSQMSSGLDPVNTRI